MERLTRRDLRPPLEFLYQLCALHDLDGPAANILSGMPHVVPADISTHNDITRRPRGITWGTEPADATSPCDGQTFEAHMHEHPFIGYR